MRRCLLIASLVLAAPPALAQDRADIDRTQIIGNRELPKVLYIVPWKDAAGAAAVEPPLPIPGDAAFAPVNRDEFLRFLRYQGFMARP